MVSSFTVRNKILIIATIVMSLIYIVWRMFFTIPFGYGMVALIAGLTLLSVELVGMIEAAVHFYNMSHITNPKRPVIAESEYPDVDVFIATYNEPVSLLYKTINGCVNMDYPDKSKVHIYLCDDSNRPEMRELAQKMNIHYLTRTDRTHAKAGNLNNALKHSSSPFIVTFDADMIPMSDFLTSSIPYFFASEKVGFVQLPQSFYNPDLFQYHLFSESRIPNEQDYFYRDVQVGRNKSNSVIYGGTNTVISRQALEDVGGFYTGVITEDFATGIQIQSKGYTCYAINEVHASGLAPSDLKSLIKQRERWARGCIQTGRKLNILFKKGLTLSQKLNYIVSISYWYSGLKRLIYIMAPILFAVFNVIVVKTTLLEVLVFWLPMYLLTNTLLKLLSQNIRNTKWSNIYETILFPSLLPVTLLETIGLSMKQFKVTRKDGAQNDRNYQFMQAIPHFVFAILSVIGIVNCIHMMFASGSMTYIVVLFWLLINLYYIVMAIFFMLGRPFYRRHERFFVQVDCSIKLGDRELHCLTNDISESGFSFMIEHPHYIPADQPVSVKLNTDKYQSEFSASVVHVKELDSQWKYAFEVTDITEEQQRQLFHIIHDRVPTLPQHLSGSVSTFDDLRINLVKRKKSHVQSNRKLARIPLDHAVRSLECGDVIIVNFNYEFVRIKPAEQYELAPSLTLYLQDDFSIKCSLVQGSGENGERLYRIDQYEEIANSETLHTLLQQWREEKLRKQTEALQRKPAQSNELDEMAYL